MTTFTETLNFSNTNQDDRAIEINKWSNVNHFDTLCLYCAENDIDVNSIDDAEFEAAAEMMADHGQSDKSTDSYFFWID